MLEKGTEVQWCGDEMILGKQRPGITGNKGEILTEAIHLQLDSPVDVSQSFQLS